MFQQFEPHGKLQVRAQKCCDYRWNGTFQLQNDAGLFLHCALFFSTASSKVALEGPGSRNGGFLELSQFFDMFLTCKKGEYWVNMGFLFCLTILFDRSRGDSRSLFRACSVAKLVCMCVLLFLYLFYVCVIWSTCNSAATCGDWRNNVQMLYEVHWVNYRCSAKNRFFAAAKREAQWNISPNINFLRYTPSCATPKSPFGPCFVYQSSVRTPPSTKQQPLTEI